MREQPKQSWVKSACPIVGPFMAWMVVLGITFMTIGCASQQYEPVDSADLAMEPQASIPQDSPPKDLIVTFSGGGYHALSGGSAWLMGMMERTGQHDLGAITKHVDAIGSNSGGSWFMTLASYSPTFVNELQKEGAYTHFAQTQSGKPQGYMSKAGEYLQAFSTYTCDEAPVATRPECRLRQKILDPFNRGNGVAYLLDAGEGSWEAAVENAVFGKTNFSRNETAGSAYYNDVDPHTLGSAPTTPWMQGKTLVIAGSLLTQYPSLTYTKRSVSALGPIYDQVQTLQAMQGEQVPFGEIPLMLQTGADRNLPVLPGGAVSLTYGTWEKKKEDWGFTPVSGTKQELTSNDLKTPVSQLKVIEAAGISSAAGAGLIDIPVLKELARELKRLVDAKGITTALNNVAPAYQLSDTARSNRMDYLTDVRSLISSQDAQTVARELAQNKVVRLADGGFVDNTAVAQMLRYLQDTRGSIPDGASIIVFDNYPSKQPVWQNGLRFPTGPDVASLFGFRGCNIWTKECSWGDEGKGLLGPFHRVFNPEGYFDQDGPLQNRLYWSSGDSVECNGTPMPLSYSRYDAQVDFDAPGSKLFGLKKGEKGDPHPVVTLHVFSALGSDGTLVPGDEDQLKCMQNMVTGIVEEVEQHGDCKHPAQAPDASNPCSLGDYLEYALGLRPAK